MDKSQLKNDQFVGHPRGLFYLFFTEMWERFSYYGMRALLVLYMTKVLFDPARGIDDLVGMSQLKHLLEGVFGTLTPIALSSQLYGLYTGLVYFTPLFGGLLADRYWGARKTVYVGGVLMAVGHFLMASERLFLPALLFLIIGNGCFKPNISVQVGNLYDAKDSRRDRAFMIFYMGINLGAFLSPLICGTLGQKVGYHWGFGAAGIGMLLGLVIYHFGTHHLPPDTLHQREADHTDHKALTTEEYKQIAALGILCVVNILFWGVYEQQGNILQLWSDEHVDWLILGFQVPSSWLQAFNPLMIFAFGPLITRLWMKQSKKGTEPNSVIKMAIGCFLVGVGYIVMVYVAHSMQPQVLVSPWWIILSVGLFTLGELYLSPIGLSLVTKISPVKLLSTMMGIWLMSSAFGNYLAGLLGSYYETLGQEKFFVMCVGLSFTAALIFIVSYKPLKRIIPDTNEKPENPDRILAH